ncbi:hypothetical protein ANOM_011046 [Aspergillus nomiae NRRL 13137]|uniref:Transcription factor domain-containing protein n=1 Tax=Aspergillus nomiae NRRL (strain ATCC 15546 / NRRL 13137 / CBS 260.88 / M93) TaxID=1509407 RepID=A0A0L1INK0_ASPN3|nr:uncharacterized protein ANOM_011046 [Aspergillus nomiae NRRL 13137]KNG81079.1 hypothetical protein ANOM_011046 [Aspergillus nomiae NRRL 13137]
MTVVGPELAVMLLTWLEILESEPCLALVVKTGSELAPLTSVKVPTTPWVYNPNNRVTGPLQATADSTTLISTAKHGNSVHEFSTWPNPSEMGLQLQKLYWDTFDPLFTSWVAGACNFYDSPGLDYNGLSIFDLCVKLDREINSIEQDPGDIPSGRQQALGSSEKKEIEARAVAITTIHCFCVRWLSVIYPELRKTPLNAWHEHMMRALWRKSRKFMLKAINVRSYQSVFSLILFGLTPVPIGVGEDEEMEGLSGSLCFQVALHHIYSLRCRRETLKFSTSKVITKDSTVTSHVSDHSITGMQCYSNLHYENMMYAAGIVIDTTSSVTLDYKPVLAVGNLGMDKELFFEVIKTRASITHERWQKGLLLQASTIGDTEADEINMCASQWKLYLWKAVAALKEALRDGCSEDLIHAAFSAVLCAMERFRLTYGPMLEACMCRLDFLGIRQRFNSWLLMCHWYLGVLLLVDAIEASERPDLLSQLNLARDDAVQGAINGFKIGSTSRYVFSDVISLAGRQTRKAQCPLLAIDPYPVHTIASSHLVLRIITKDHEDGKITVEAFETLLEIISNALEHLPGTSHSVEVARQHVRSVQLSLGNQISAIPNTNTDDQDWQDANPGPTLLFSNSMSDNLSIVSDGQMEEYITLLYTAF